MNGAPMSRAQVEQQRNRSGDGRYAAKVRGEPTVSLSGATEPQVGVWATSGAASVYSPHTDTRNHPRLAAHDQAVSSRLAVATSPTGGSGHLSATDPDPVVRAAATGRWDLTETDRKALEADAEVERLLEKICA